MKKVCTLFFCLLTGNIFTYSQTLEFIAGNGPSGQGPTTSNQTVNFSRNTDNPSGNTFVAPSPGVSVTYSLSNQQLPADNHPGILFGAANSPSNTSPVADLIYAEMDYLGTPTDDLFTAAAPANSGGMNTTGASNTNPNYAIVLFLNANYMAGMPLNSKNYYGNLTLTFSRAVTNPVLQLSGMGAAFSQHGHTAELKLNTPDLSLTRLDGNQFLSVSGADIVNTASNITGAAAATSHTPVGAAAGSVQVNGTNITSVTFGVYLRGSGGNNSQWQSNNGVAGDKFSIGVSLRDIITLSGNVFYDSDGMMDAMIDNNSNALGYPFNATVLYANLFTAGDFVTSVPVAANGTYSASVAPNTDYTVIISTTQGSSGTSTTNFQASLPTGWGFTGEGTATTGDGTPDGRVVSVAVAETDFPNVNFGTDPLPESYNKTNNITGSPTPGSDYMLNTVPMEGSEGNPAGNTASSWAGKRLVITSLPSNNFELRYNGTLITAAAIGTEGYTISNYDPSLLTIRSTVTTPVGTNVTNFNYAIIDAALLKDPSPATYTVNFSSPLPIELVAFDAVADCPDIQLTWETGLERNIRFMELQVSGNGEPFTTIGRYMSKGNNSRYTATYNDKNGKYLFRLSITEQSGEQNFSRIAAASLNCSQPVLEVYPVPLYGNTLTIQYYAAEKAAAILYDAQGRTIKKITLAPGQNAIALNMLSDGVYWLKLLNHSVGPVKIVKQ